MLLNLFLAGITIVRKGAMAWRGRLKFFSVELTDQLSGPFH